MIKLVKMNKKNILISGGCRSGKSRHALALGQKFTGRKVFLATAEIFDDEMKSRVQKHREERSDDWITIEEPLDPLAAILKEKDKADVILLDCLTLWVSNLLLKYDDEKVVLEIVNELLEALPVLPCSLMFITNEVGGGIVPENKLGRDFRDLAGLVNQRIAEVFDEVVYMVSGIPVKIKEPIQQNGAGNKKSTHEFSKEKKQGLYEAIYQRRDMRHFLPDPVDPEVLGRVLHAAHHAGSVGYMQPWSFMVIQDPEIKKRVADNFSEASREGAERFEGERKKLYESLKLEGIQDAPVNICVTCDRNRSGPNVLGRNTMLEMDLFSTCCAVQNLWLAARAEGLAVGWVSILYPERLKADLGIPDSIEIVAYLCVGHTESFYKKPLLESAGWGKRLDLKDLVFYDRWESKECDNPLLLPE